MYSRHRGVPQVRNVSLLIPSIAGRRRFTVYISSTNILFLMEHFSEGFQCLDTICSSTINDIGECTRDNLNGVALNEVKCTLKKLYLQ